MITGTIRGVKQPSNETWLDIARAHQDFHSRKFYLKGHRSAMGAVDMLAQSPVSDHRLDAGWLAVDASTLQRRRSGKKCFDIADRVWRDVQSHSTDIIDRLQAAHALAFLPMFRQVYLGETPNLVRLDKRMSHLSQSIIEQEPFTDVVDLKKLIGVSDEIAISALVNRFSLHKKEDAASAWPTSTYDDRSKSHAMNTDLNIGSYPIIEQQIQIKHREVDSEIYEANGTPILTMRTAFPEVINEPLFVINALATTTPHDPLSVELSHRAIEAIETSTARVSI
jgi:hypothetical protein